MRLAQRWKPRTGLKQYLGPRSYSPPPIGKVRSWGCGCSRSAGTTARSYRRSPPRIWELGTTWPTTFDHRRPRLGTATTGTCKFDCWEMNTPDKTHQDGISQECNDICQGTLVGKYAKFRLFRVTTTKGLLPSRQHPKGDQHNPLDGDLPPQRRFQTSTTTSLLPHWQSSLAPIRSLWSPWTMRPASEISTPHPQKLTSDSRNKPWWCKGRKRRRSWKWRLRCVGVWLGLVWAPLDITAKRCYVGHQIISFLRGGMGRMLLGKLSVPFILSNVCLHFCCLAETHNVGSSINCRHPKTQRGQPSPVWSLVLMAWGTERTPSSQVWSNRDQIPKDY